MFTYSYIEYTLLCYMGIELVFCYYNYNQPFVVITLSADSIPRKSQITLPGPVPHLSGYIPLQNQITLPVSLPRQCQTTLPWYIRTLWSYYVCFKCLDTDFVVSTNTINICLILSTFSPLHLYSYDWLWR